MNREISKDFIKAMDEGLQRGRDKGYHGWDNNWDGTIFSSHPDGVNGQLMQHLYSEILELAIAINDDDKNAIRHEAADVANLAMMVADFHGAMDDG